jgi:hypothetical protein
MLVTIEKCRDYQVYRNAVRPRLQGTGGAWYSEWLRLHAVRLVDAVARISPTQPTRALARPT